MVDMEQNKSGVYEPKVSNLPSIESRQERLEFLNYKRQEGNLIKESRKTTAQTVLSTLGIIALAAVVLRFVVFLFIDVNPF